jgi:peptidoglycan/LPS O-acetylase OafA/YrhL
MDSRYFSGFDPLRFFAAALVVLSHATITSTNLTGMAFDLPVFHKGGLAVEFFFTLSGFLITYLLLCELKKSATIDIKAFYYRRVFRIWPLYFIIVLSGFLILGFLYPALYHQNYFTFTSMSQGLMLYIFFLPNYAAMAYKVGLLYPLWSIGVEEQFYLMWAPIIKYLKRFMIPAIGTVIVVSAALSAFAHFHYSPDDKTGMFITTLKFHCMGMGGIFAYYFYHRTNSPNGLLQQSWLQYALQALTLMAILSSFSSGLPVLDELVRSIIFSGLLLTVASRNMQQPARTGVLNYLGKISYGIYMYHMLVDYILRTVIAKTPLATMTNGHSFLVVYFLALLAVTILLAGVSYRFLEQPIIQWGKNRNLGYRPATVPR